MKTVVEVDQSNLVNFIQYCSDTVYTPVLTISQQVAYNRTAYRLSFIALHEIILQFLFKNNL